MSDAIDPSGDGGRPVLSVTILCYNYARFLPTCIESVLGQDLEDLQVHVINDCSTDDTREVVQDYLTDSRVELVDHVTNQGFVRSLIEGSERSRGTYLSVVSADDWVVDPTAFRRQIEMLEADVDATFAFTAFGVWSDATSCEGIVHPVSGTRRLSREETARVMLLGKAIHHSGTVIRRSAYDAVGGYDPTKRYAIDIDMWVRLAGKGPAVYIDEPLHAYRQHGANMTGRSDTVRETIRERLDTIDSCSSTDPAVDAVRGPATRRTVSEWSNLYAFERDDMRTAWRYWSIAARIRPWATVAQTSTLRLVLRTVTGRRGYLLARRVVLRALGRDG